MLTGSIFVTGGAGFLGKAIIRRAKLEKWDCRFTIFSRDDHKHALLLREFPDVHCIRGDIAGDLDYLASSMIGHDLVIHAGATKYVDLCELNVSDSVRVNIHGSENVAKASILSKVKQAVLITTDKSCHPCSLYGVTKLAAERLFQEYSKHEIVKFNMARYGNVISSSGSVIVDWRRKLKEQGYIDATDPDMTRFWLSVDMAIDLILKSLNEPNGTITIPKLKGLSMRKMEEYVLPLTTKVVYRGLRPGEKRHEELLTTEEARFVSDYKDYYRLFPVFSKAAEAYSDMRYISNEVEQLTKQELLGMIGE